MRERDEKTHIETMKKLQEKIAGVSSQCHTTSQILRRILGALGIQAPRASPAAYQLSALAPH